MQANVKWVEGDTFIGRSNSNHNVVFDAGSDSAAPSPMEMVLMSVGCCSSVDVVSILKKAKRIRFFFGRGLKGGLTEIPTRRRVYEAWDTEKRTIRLKARKVSGLRIPPGHRTQDMH